MEFGAIKQAFNNEIISLKKNLNQAKVQIIHKLTRKAKTLTEKKVQEKLKGKFIKKAESAVKEVLIIKKIKAREIARFIVTHKGQLNEYLNRPTVDKDKACARLLLHKALQNKYKMLRERFSNMSIEDLLMSRQERLRRKKEERLKQKNKKKDKDDNKPVQAQGECDVEDIDTDGIQVRNESDESEDDMEPVNGKCEQSGESENESQSGDENEVEDNESDDDDLNEDASSLKNNSIDRKLKDSETGSIESNNEDEEIPDNQTGDTNTDDESSVSKFVKVSSNLLNSKTNNKSPVEEGIINRKNMNSKKINDKHKDSNKNKNLKNKILLKKFNKEKIAMPAQENKVVDPFFITSTGENYMSVAEPRQPDEVKEVHKQGNRQYRRAVMFGHVPKAKPRRNDFRPERSNQRFNENSTDTFNRNFKTNGFQKHANEKFNKPDNSGNKTNFNDRRNNGKGTEDVTKPEKLHPSWEAKKKQSGILPFQGKKIVFDES